jgi:hypothetical protein
MKTAVVMIVMIGVVGVAALQVRFLNMLPKTIAWPIALLLLFWSIKGLIQKRG